MEVVSDKEFGANPRIYSQGLTAVEFDGLVYPVRQNNNGPGVYQEGPFNVYIDPPTDEKDNYSSDNIIDFSQATNFKELIIQQQKLVDEEKTILSNVGDLFVPRITDKDTPFMTGLKRAIIAKEIDINSYKTRFGENYNNDRRILSKNSITIDKFETMCDIFDIKATLTLEDKTSDIANPMNQVIVIDIGGHDDGGEENEAG